MGGCWGRRSRFCLRWCIAVRDLMQGAYPELVDSAARVAKVVEAEEGSLIGAEDGQLKLNRG